MSKFTCLFLAILVWLQYALWFGKNSIRDYVRVTNDIELQQATNDRLKARNQELIAEINDLNKGLDAIEERARNELGMIKHNEYYYRIIPEKLTN